MNLYSLCLYAVVKIELCIINLSDSKLECLKPYNFQRECVKDIYCFLK